MPIYDNETAQDLGLSLVTAVMDLFMPLFDRVAFLEAVM